MKKLFAGLGYLLLSSAVMGQAFAPLDGATVSISVSASSQRVAIGKDGPVRMMNNGTATVWVRCGDNTVVATTNDIPVPSGSVEVLSFNRTTTNSLNCAAIAAGATGIIYFTPGIGI